MPRQNYCWQCCGLVCLLHVVVWNPPLNSKDSVTVIEDSWTGTPHKMPVGLSVLEFYTPQLQRPESSFLSLLTVYYDSIPPTRENDYKDHPRLVTARFTVPVGCDIGFATFFSVRLISLRIFRFYLQQFRMQFLGQLFVLVCMCGKWYGSFFRWVPPTSISDFVCSSVRPPGSQC